MVFIASKTEYKVFEKKLLPVLLGPANIVKGRTKIEVFFSLPILSIFTSKFIEQSYPLQEDLSFLTLSVKKLYRRVV